MHHKNGFYGTALPLCELDQCTSVDCGISCIGVIEVWCGVGRRIVANHKVDCSLEEKSRVLYCSYHFPKENELHISAEPTPIFCPLSLTKGTFLDGSDLAWPVERSRRGILVDPRNLIREKKKKSRLRLNSEMEVLLDVKTVSFCRDRSSFLSFSRLYFYLYFCLTVLFRCHFRTTKFIVAISHLPPTAH